MKYGGKIRGEIKSNSQTSVCTCVFANIFPILLLLASIPFLFPFFLSPSLSLWNLVLIGQIG